MKYQLRKQLALFCDWTNALDQTVVREITARYEDYARTAVPLVGGDKPADFKVPPVWGKFTTGLHP